ncbi:MAG: ribonuclease R family protein [Cyanobacteria bacterium P01_H01_bin.121]
MERGTLVEFRQGGERCLAVIERAEGKKHWIALDERGQSHTLHPRQFTYVVASERFAANDIAGFREGAATQLDSALLEVAWEIFSEEESTATPETLAQLIFSEQTPVFCYAAYQLLSDDKLYFKQRKDGYEPRSATQVNELKHQLAVELQRQQAWHGFLERLNLALEGKRVIWEEHDRLWLVALERLATFDEEAKNRTPALDALKAAKYPESAIGAFELLVALGLWGINENLPLRRSQVPTQFSAKVLDVAQSCLLEPPADPDAKRRDLTHLKVYTIDDESTQEIDDGLSVEFLEDGRQRIWVHIADPTRWVLPGDELDLEARRRSTTIYLPTGMVPMFPSELATGPMSLVQGKHCCALSFGVLLTESGAIDDFQVCPALICPTYRLTYADVDEMLELGIRAEPELEALKEWTKRRQDWRRSQGSITIRMPEASIKVSADETEITIDLLEESQSRRLVAEMMILAGEVAGTYGQQHDLPLPFRSQPQPELPADEELALLPAGLVRECAIRRCMPRSEVGLTPGRHASLGLDAYTQVTSPIRRYSDLIAHFQIKSHLRGDAVPFNREQLQELILSNSAVAYEAVLVERQTNRYWGLEYLRRQGNEHPWSALVLRWLREHENLALVLIEDLGLELATRFRRAVDLGERVLLRVSHVDPRRDTIHLEELPPQAAQAMADA